MANSDSKSVKRKYRIEIAIAIIGVIGVLGAAIISKIDWSRKKNFIENDCSSFEGTWYREYDDLKWTIFQDGNNLKGGCNQGYFDHKFEAEVNENCTANGRIVRTSKIDHCVTIMFVSINKLDNNRMQWTIISTDGKCDLKKSYTEVSEWVKID